MAKVHNELPKHNGELRVANRLRQFDDRFHLWFSIDSVPKVPDIDLILIDETTGAFVIEIKAVTLEMFESFSFSTCQIRGRGFGRSPQAQAGEARDGLLSFLSNKRIRHPFMIATACFPLIRRAEWNARWGTDLHNRFDGDFSNSIIFEDDLEGGSDVLSDRLRNIWNCPPARKGAPMTYDHQTEQNVAFPTVLTGVLVGHSKIPPAPSDMEKLRKIEGCRWNL
jgi:hypothetical protein